MEISREKYATLDSIQSDKYTSLVSIPRDKYSSLVDSISRDKYSSLDSISRDKYTSLVDSMPNLIYSGHTSPLNISSREFSRDCEGDASFWTSPSRSHLHPSGGGGGGASTYDPGYNSYHSTIDGDTYAGSTPGGAIAHNAFYNPYGVPGGVMPTDSPQQDTNTHAWTTGVFYADRDFGTRDLHPLQRPGYAGTDSNGNYPDGEYHSGPWSTVQPCGVLDLQHDVMNKHYNGGIGGGGVTMGDMDTHGLELSSSCSNTCGGGGGGGMGGSVGGGGGKRKRRRVITIDQRRAANVRERRRMSHLNEAFDGLRKRVPTFAYEKKLSRIDTLRLSVMYIKFMAELLDSLAVVGEGGCVPNHGAPPAGVRVSSGGDGRSSGEQRAEKSTRGDKRGGIRSDLTVDVLRSGGVRDDLSVDVYQDVGGGGGGGGEDVLLPRGLQRMSAAVGSVCTEDEEDGDGEESYLSDPSEEGEESSDRGGARGVT